MKNLLQPTNPYLPSWEYVPDGEPYVFDGRVYVYGSHDKSGGDVYCMLDYVCWSAAVHDLGNWRYEGIIFRKDQDPENGDGQGNLYAPDVTVGPDGRYYLYYVLSSVGIVSVAVCDTPAGKYEFYGHVHYADGSRLGERAGDEPQFDPGVLTENGRTYLYTGFCGVGDDSRHGAMATVLGEDMLTIIEEPVFIVPGSQYSKGTSFEGHEFFEAPSIRKRGDKYYFIYSSRWFHELSYAVSDRPTGGFEYAGVLVSNGDLHIDSYKPAEKTTFYCANNHGSMVEIEGEWYIFYHRHTNGTNYSRQGCFEKLRTDESGNFIQAEMTSCCSMAPLRAEGEYPTYIACNLFTNETDCTYVPWSGWMDDRFPKIMQDGGDRGDAYCAAVTVVEDEPIDDKTVSLYLRDEKYAYVNNFKNGNVMGFKYFDCKGVKKMSVRYHGYGTGRLVLRTRLDGDECGSFPIEYANGWKRVTADVNIPDGIRSIYFFYEGVGQIAVAAFTFE